jgi:hypothetical protein
VDQVADGIAVSPDGQLIAYATGSCSGNITAVELINLETGQRGRIQGEANGLAWAPNGKTLAVAAPVTNDQDRILLVRDPFHAATVASQRPLPCPPHSTCAQDSPSFDQRGRLFYQAQIDPQRGRPCSIYDCSKMTYAVVSVHGSRTEVLTSRLVYGRVGAITSGAVNPAGTAMIYAVPNAKGQIRLWRWSQGSRPVPIPAPGHGRLWGTITDPVW